MSLKLKMISSKILIISLILLSICINSQQTQLQKPTIQYNKVGQKIRSINTDANQGRVYHPIKINQLQQKYLFVEVLPTQQSRLANFIIYLYRGTQQTPFKVCRNQQADSCFVSSRDLQKNSAILIIVQCQGSCQYDLYTYWSNLEHIKVGSTTRFMFGDQQNQIYHLELQKDKNFSQLRIIIKPQTRRQMFDKIKIYGKFGFANLPSAQQNDFKSMHLWADVEGIYLNTTQVKDTNINLLIVGEVQTVYVLTCDLINQTTHVMNAGTHLDQYLEPGEVANYHLNFYAQKNVLEYEQYVFKFAAFNGNMSIEIYTDQDHTKTFTTQPYQYMSDSQYIITRDQIKSIKKGLFISVHSFNRISTYTMSFIGRSLQASIQLHQHIYEFMQITYKKSKVLYFDAYSFLGEQVFQDNYVFTIHLINIKGSHSLNFRLCKGLKQNCLDDKTYKQSTKQLNVGSFDQIGTKKSYRLEIPKSQLVDFNSAQQQLTVLIIVDGIDSKSSHCAIEYVADSKYQILRESRPIESKFKMFQTKTFKFTNVDAKIKQVRIHLNKINGLIQVVSLRDAPTQSTSFSKKQLSNIFSFTQQLTSSPIYIIITAQQDSIISLNVQLIHQNNEYISTIDMQQDVKFKIKIPPLGYQYLEVHPIFAGLFFDYQSTALAIVCDYNIKTKKCSKEVPEMGVQGSIQIPDFKSKTQVILVTNPSATKSIQFSSIYHSATYSHCQHRQTGVISNQVIQTNECYSFALTKLTNLQISLIRLDMGTLNVVFLLCDNLFQLKNNNGFYQITTEEMQKNCRNATQKIIIVAVTSVNQTAQKQGKKVVIKAKMSVQYLDQPAIVIPEGVAYQTSKVVKQQALQVFYYQVINPRNTSILLSNKEGSCYFTVKVSPTTSRHLFLSSPQFQFSSSSTNYYKNPGLTIPQQFFTLPTSCHSDCSLIIKVHSKDNLGSVNKFVLEVMQDYVVLEERKMKDQFLLKGAIKQYRFVNTIKGNEILVQTSDNNHKCTKITLAQREYPTKDNSLMIEYGNQLLYEEALNMTYFIAVQAVQNCAYHISVSTTPTHITHLQRGKLGYLKLKADEVKFFMFHRLNTNPFKVLSVHVYGQIDFYLQKSDPQKLAEMVKQKQINYTAFKTKGQFKNRLVVNDPKYLCENCYYILACHAKRVTQTSIYLGDDQSYLSISQRKSINDIFMKKGEILKGHYYDIKPTDIKIKVHSGKLGLKVQYYDQSYENTYIHHNDLYKQSFKLKRKENDWSPATVTLSALSDQTLYSIRFAPKVSDSYSNLVQQTQISPGEPNYIYLTKDRVHCLRGYLRQKNQMIMITSDDLYEHGLHEMKVQTTVDGKEVKTKKEVVRNIVAITFQTQKNIKDQKDPKKFGVCVSTRKDWLSATAFQTEDVNILPPDVQTIAYGNQKYAIRPDGNFLIDVYECIGKANLSYSETLKNLSESKKTGLDILGMTDQPHAFKIQEHSTTFLQINSEMSIVRWIPIDTINQTGLGYVQYQVGSFSYDSRSNSINVSWEGLKNKTSSGTTIMQINYTIIVAGDLKNLQNAQNCEVFQQTSVLRYSKTDTSLDKSSPLVSSQLLNQHKSLQINKTLIKQKYPSLQNLYLSIIADVDIQPVSGDIEHYRFFYIKQQLAKQVLTQNNQYLDKVYTIGVIVASVVAFLIFTFVFTRKVIPMLARLKNSMLVQQKDQKDQDLGDQPPPSSQRKTIQFTLQTQDKMTTIKT